MQGLCLRVFHALALLGATTSALDKKSSHSATPTGRIALPEDHLGISHATSPEQPSPCQAANEASSALINAAAADARALLALIDSRAGAASVEELRSAAARVLERLELRRAEGGLAELRAPPGKVPGYPVTTTAAPEDEYAGPDWAISSSEGGSDKSGAWDNVDKQGWGSWCVALSFCLIIGLAPMVSLQKGTRTSSLEKVEVGVLLVWLIGGLYMFTQHIVFQSPHFSKPRSLTLEEAVYLTSQIMTTVGYGDITPAHFPGQCVVGLFVLTSIMIVTQIVGELVGKLQDMMEDTLMEDHDQAAATTEEEKKWAALVPVLQSGGVFLFFVLLGATFFCLFPGEGKTFGQGIYMSIVTLSSVGFGAFTPVTHGGMVFGAYWMLFGVASLGALVSARTAFCSALNNIERDKRLHEALVEHDGALPQGHPLERHHAKRSPNHSVAGSKPTSPHAPSKGDGLSTTMQTSA